MAAMAFADSRSGEVSQTADKSRSTGWQKKSSRSPARPHPSFTAAIEKLRETGFTPAGNFDAALAATVNWFRCR